MRGVVRLRLKIHAVARELPVRLLRAIQSLTLLYCLGGTPLLLAQHRPATTRPDTAAFFRWWRAQLSTAGRATPPDGVRRRWVRFEDLNPCTDCRVRDEDVPGHTPVRALRLFQSPAGEAIILIPVDTVTAVSWLLTRPPARLAELPLSFAASQQAYGPDEVDFYLYWLPDEAWPLVELITNHPACVPSTLYAYDHEAARYRVVRTACGG
jgi:hypothetical protein